MAEINCQESTMILNVFKVLKTQFVLLGHMTMDAIDVIFSCLDIGGVICELDRRRQRSPFQFVISGADNGLQVVGFLGLFPCPILSCLLLAPVFSVVILGQSGSG